MPLQAANPVDVEPAPVCDQLADALQYLSETAPSSLEKMVFKNAEQLCRGLIDQRMENAASRQTIDPPLANGPEGDLLPALQYLQKESQRHDLQVVECILIATISLWMIAEDIEMIRKRRLHDEETKSRH